MTNEMQTTKAAKMTARKIALACYPEYKGRKIKVATAETYSLSNYWEGGSRDYAVAYDLRTGETRQASPETSNPFSYVAQERKPIAIPAGVAIVEHTIFCGKDCGITIYVNPAADKAGLLSEVR